MGLRNALIRNFNELKLRADAGAMFENLCVLEKLKNLSGKGQFTNLYFWRTYDQKEIDLIEEKEGKLAAFGLNYPLKRRGLLLRGKNLLPYIKIVALRLSVQMTLKTF